MIYHLSQSNGYWLLTIIKAAYKPFIYDALAILSPVFSEGKAVFFYKT